MIKKSHRRKLSSNELMILVFTSEFLICFICIYSHLLPLYALLSVVGFGISCWHYQDYKKIKFRKKAVNVTKKF